MVAIASNKRQILSCLLSFLVGYGLATFKDEFVGGYVANRARKQTEFPKKATNADALEVSRMSASIMGPLRPINTSTTSASLPSITTEATADVPNDPTETSPRVSPSSSTGFDKIVQTAYQQAIVQKPSPQPRPTFDVTYWEEQSGLTTHGGLTTKDRILLGQIYGNANSLFEYGLGESTYMANYLKVPRYAGIDSDPVWVGMARDKVSNDFRFYLADIGPTKAWGYPSKENARATKNILDYQLAPLIVEPEPFDVYMVDGRYRLPCALASFLHASARGGHPNQTTVLVHDCGTSGQQGGRTQYKRADHLLDLETHSGQLLCVYKRKPTTTDEQLAQLWHQYADQIGRRVL